jgi:hypothetical protein
MACRVFGLLPHPVCDLLDHYRNIRNHCAHAKKVASLGDADIANSVDALRAFLKNSDALPRSKTPRQIIIAASKRLVELMATFSYPLGEQLSLLLQRDKRLIEILLSAVPPPAETPSKPHSSNHSSKPPSPKRRRKSPLKRPARRGRDAQRKRR